MGNTKKFAIGDSNTKQQAFRLDKDGDSAAIHLLRRFTLPDRFEALRARLGSDVSKIISPPANSVDRIFHTIAYSVRQRGQGLLIPLLASSGAGKTTFANSLSHLYPLLFRPTLSFIGTLDFEALRSLVNESTQNHPRDDDRIVPINVDDRESFPPSAQELATLKRFLRSAEGSHCIVIWPETSSDIAEIVARSYEQVVGQSAVHLPVVFEGPDRTLWHQITEETLRIVNGQSTLEDVGINPEAYRPRSFDTIGRFMQAIANDLASRLTDLIAQTIRPVSLAIVFVSNSRNAGILSELTAQEPFGLLTPKALVNATRQSVIGKWWAERPGLLSKAVYTLNAHALCLPPSSSVQMLRKYGLSDIQEVLGKKGVKNPGETFVLSRIENSDFGLYLRGDLKATSEKRGSPGVGSSAAFESISGEYGMTSGRDKRLNRGLANAIKVFLDRGTIGYEQLVSETKLDFCALRPDTAVYFAENVLCVEYAWRSGDFLTSSNRASIAEYILTKLQNYSRELGWI